MMRVLLLFFWNLWICVNAAATSSGARKPTPTFNPDIDNGSDGSYPKRTYSTERDITSPRTNFVRWDPQCDDGSLIMIAPRGPSFGNPGPMILDATGNLVWTQHYDNSFGGQAYGLEVQQYRGQDYLTFWLGDDSVKGHGSGSYYMIDAKAGLDADLHEFHITAAGTALVTVYEVIEHNIVHSSGEDPTRLYVWDGLFQEFDLETNELLFQWRASDHINLFDSYREIFGGENEDEAFDYFHINSVEKDEHGNYLISARYFHSIYYIDGTSGDIIWTLGGTGNDFLDLSNGEGIDFAWQHHARFHPLDGFPGIYHPSPPRAGVTTVLLSLFDNAAEDHRYDYGHLSSRGLLLELTYPTHKRAPAMERDEENTEPAQEEDIDINISKVNAINGTNSAYAVRVIEVYDSLTKIRSSSQGSMQILPQGSGRDPKVLVGFGSNAAWAEFAANGTLLCEAHFAAASSWETGDVQSYRVLKHSWIGTPTSPPRIALTDDEDEIYVSWNGATEVAEWVLQCSDDDSTDDEAWDDVARVVKTDFETAIRLTDDARDARYLRVTALDRNGKRLPHGTSDVVEFQDTDQSVFGLSSLLTPGFDIVTMILLSWSAIAGLLLTLHLCRKRKGNLWSFWPWMRTPRWHKGLPYQRLRSGSAV